MADDDFLHTAEILKAALPYVDVRTKTTMDLLVKFYELISCFSSLRTNQLSACDYKEQKFDMEGLLSKIRPLCNEKEKGFIDRILGIYNAKRMMDMYNTYMSAMQTMQEFGGFGSGASDGEAADNVMNNFAGFDFSSIFGSMNSSGNSDSSEEKQTTESFSSFTEKEEPHGDHSETSKAGDTENSPDMNKDKSEDGNSGMFDMLKNMVSPDQMSTFENLRMLFNTMSYDNNSKSDDQKGE